MQFVFSAAKIIKRRTLVEFFQPTPHIFQRIGKNDYKIWTITVIT